MHWNYRVLRYEDGTLALHEVFYDEDQRPSMYTADPVYFAVDADEGLSGLTAALELALGDARARPVLDLSDIGTKAQKPQTMKSVKKGHHPFSELTKDWPADRRRRVEQAKSEREQDIEQAPHDAAAPQPGAEPASSWQELEAAVLRLSEADAQAFAEALLNPPEPSPRLRKAAQLHQKLVGGKAQDSAIEKGKMDK